MGGSLIVEYFDCYDILDQSLYSCLCTCKILIFPNDRVEKSGQFLFAIVRAEQDEQFVSLQFVEMQAAQPVVQAVLQKNKILVQPFADRQQGEVVFKTLGNELGQLL